MKNRTRTGIFPVLCRLGRIAAAYTALLLCEAPRPLEAQFTVRSWLAWRTIETRHFAFHYPVELEAWTRDVAARADAIDSAVGRVVGYAPARKTHVVVDDPYATSNGSAWPFLNGPIINLWATPPDPREDIGDFRDWGEMLVSHEFGHIAHLTRPSRNSLTRLLWRALPVDLGPVALRAPRWAVEGYATYIEGQVTGSGRPHGAWRAAFLRQWALEGQLPRYDQLNASGSYEGGEFAYLAGSAFLEWLVSRQGDSSLVHLWRRLSARQNRTFDDAFVGVFGESPRALYGRFTTEVTGKAVEIQHAVGAAPDTGEIVQRVAWTTGDPAISPDGGRVALVLRSATAPSRVVIWGTAPEPDSGKARRDSILLARDPEDVAARPIYPPPKRALVTLRARGGAPYEGPRFLRDGRIVLWRNARRLDGTLSPDLYLWNPRRRSVHRVTHGAAVRDPDPLPDGRSAAATQCRGGSCSVVLVNLTDGRVTTLQPGDPRISFYRPRVSPDGARAVASMHTIDGWRLVIVDLATPNRSPRDVPGTAAGNEYDAAWIDANTLVATSNASGAPNVVRIDLTTGTRTGLSNVTGAAVAPEPNPRDRSVWFLSLYSRGYDVRRLASTSTTTAQTVLDASLAPVAPIPVAPSRIASVNPVSDPKSFGFGPRLFRWIPAPHADADGASALLALVSSDIIGRSEVLEQFAVGDPAHWRGANFGFAWRGFRPTIRLNVFAATERQSATRTPVDRPFAFDTRMHGLELAVANDLLADTWALRYKLGASIARDSLEIPSLTPMIATATTRRLAFADLSATWIQRGARSALSESLGATRTDGRSFDTRFQRTTFTAALATSGPGTIPVSASAVYGFTGAAAPPFEQFSIGGGPSPLIDHDLLSQRIRMPALPEAISVGASVFAYRISLNTPPLAPYVWAASTAPRNQSFETWYRVVGLEWSGAIPAIPVAGTPAARGQIGVGESLDPPFRHRVRAYVSLVLNP